MPQQYWDGNYFTNNGASAIVLQQGNSWIIAFRGTDGDDDIARYPELASGSYINHFQPLLNAIAANAPGAANFSFTGASLGGGATNLMANIADSQYGGRFGDAKFVAFASPNISSANGILNIGVENDPVYKAINNYGDFASSLDNLVLATAEYMAGNYDGRHPFDTYAHTASQAEQVLARLQASAFFDLMQPDSVVLFDAHSGQVQDVTPGRENVGAFYLGEDVGDRIAGRNGDDFIEGFQGSDDLNGGGGDDALAGGAGDDTIDGDGGTDRAVFSGNRSQYTLTDLGGGSVRVAGADGTDTLFEVEQLVFADQTVSWPPPPDSNAPPVITSDGGDANASKTVFENNTAVTTVTASDPQGTTLAYSIVGGADAQRFSINSASGVLSFVAAPDFEAPGDADRDNSYLVQVRASDGSLFDEQTITVNVADVAPVITGDNGDNNLDGTSENDTINGFGGHDTLIGGGGRDTLNGGDGDDFLQGGPDADTMLGGAGRDRYVVEHGGDVAIENAGEGLDTIVAFIDHTLEANVEDMVLEGGNIGTGNAEANRIDGHGGNNILNGRSGNDLLLGYGGDDTLDGGLDADTMRDGSGDDRYVLDNGGDVAVENAGEGFDTIIAFLDHTIEDNVENMNLEVGTFGTGNALANRIDGNGSDNKLSGRDGKDLLLGYGGDDTLEGGEENDMFVFANGSGTDTIIDMQGGVSRGDVIDIRDFGFADLDAVLAASTDGSGGVLIQLDVDDTLLVQNMTKAQFDSNDFLLA